MRFKNNTDYFVCVLSSTNIHCNKVVTKLRGFNLLKKGDAFDFSLTAFYKAEGQGRVYQAISDYDWANKTIECREAYNPEI